MPESTVVLGCFGIVILLTGRYTIWLHGGVVVRRRVGHHHPHVISQVDGLLTCARLCLVESISIGRQNLSTGRRHIFCLSCIISHRDRRRQDANARHSLREMLMRSAGAIHAAEIAADANILVVRIWWR